MCTEYTRHRGLTPRRDPYWLKDLGSEYLITQAVGGTRGSEYIYVPDGEGLLVNVGYLPGARLVSSEGRAVEVYRVQRGSLGGLFVVFSFSNGGYMFVEACRVGEVVECYMCPREVCRLFARRFRPIGGEKAFADLYARLTEGLISEIRHVAEKARAEITFAGRAEKLREAFEDPEISLCTSMVFNTVQGRVMSLEGKLSSISELWVVAKVIEAMGGVVVDKRLRVGHTSNVPFARVEASGRTYTMFYQPSVYPHVIIEVVEDVRQKFLKEPDEESNLVIERRENKIMIHRGSGRVRRHVIPDIVVFEGEVEADGWGNLHEVVEKGRQPMLLIEVKTGLETAQWRSPQYVLSQLRAYKDQLRPRRIALAVLTSVKSRAILTELRNIGVDVFEELLSPDAQRLFAEYVRKVLSAS